MTSLIPVLKAFRLAGLFPRNFRCLENAAAHNNPTDGGPWIIGHVSYTYLILSITFLPIKVILNSVYMLQVIIEDYKGYELLVFIGSISWEFNWIMTDLISAVSILKNHKKIAKSINVILLLHHKFISDEQNKHINNSQNVINWLTISIYFLYLCSYVTFSSVNFTYILVFMYIMPSFIIVNFLLTYYFYNISLLFPKIIDYSRQMIHVGHEGEKDLASTKRSTAKLLKMEFSFKKEKYKPRNTSINKMELFAFNKSSDEIIIISERALVAIEDSLRLMMESVNLFIMLQMVLSTVTVTFGLYSQIKDPTLSSIYELDFFVIVAALQIFFYVNTGNDVIREVSNNILKLGQNLITMSNRNHQCLL